MYLGYRKDLSKHIFLDWNFLDLSYGVSFTTVGLGYDLFNTFSVYGMFSPLIFFHDFEIKEFFLKARTLSQLFFFKKDGFHAENILPFMGLGVHFGLGVRYRLNRYMSIISQLTMQMSYFDAIYSAYESIGTPKPQIMKKLFFQKRMVRQRISVGIELHSSRYT